MYYIHRYRVSDDILILRYMRHELCNIQHHISHELYRVSDDILILRYSGLPTHTRAMRYHMRHELSNIQHHISHELCNIQHHISHELCNTNTIRGVLCNSTRITTPNTI